MASKDYIIEQMNYNSEQDILEITVLNRITEIKHHFKTRDKSIVKFCNKRFELQEFLMEIEKSNG